MDESTSIEILDKTMGDLDPADIITAISKLSGPVTAKTLQAWEVVQSGVVPKDSVKHRPGYPKEIPYVAHQYVQRVFNAAFRWFWDFECLEYQAHEDGSVSSRNRLTVRIPVNLDNAGNIIYITRTVTEIGSHPAQFKKKDNKLVISEVTGKPEFTMDTADRVASSVSRGLAKCAYRMFNIGTDLTEKEADETPLEAWNTLVKFAGTVGVTRERVIKICKEKGVTEENLIDNFQNIYEIVYNEGKGGESSVPLD